MRAPFGRRGSLRRPNVSAADCSRPNLASRGAIISLACGARCNHRASGPSMKSQTISIVFVLAVSVLVARIASGDTAARVAYPDGYRDWTHVKSALMSPHHANYGVMGGFHHIYANEKAMAGYRSGEF